MQINRLAFFTILLTYVLIVFGGYVASSESGMGCGPDWPLCNGVFIPILQGDTLIEFGHRVIGAILAVLSISLFLKIVYAGKGTTVQPVAWIMLFMLVCQVLLGAAVVVMELPVLVVSAHLLIAMLFLASLIWIWRNTYIEEAEREVFTVPSLSSDKGNIVLKHLNVLLVLLLLTMVFGAYIKHQLYGLSCGWFECGDFFLPITIPELFQTAHRLLALVTALYIVILVLLSFSRKWGEHLQNRLLVAGLFIFLQMIIGVLTVLTYIDIPWAVLHLAIGTALFAVVFEMRVYMGIQLKEANIQAEMNEIGEMNLFPE